MKLYQRLSIATVALTLGVFGGVRTGNAQIWANYGLRDNVRPFQFIGGNGVNLIPNTSFLNFVGGIDPDDGVANNIPVGFTFDYNGYTANTINVCVNGWISVGPQPTPITPNNNNNLFDQTPPNNTIAPYWGDHYYRTFEPGYTPSRIQYQTVILPVPGGAPGSTYKVFTMEWKNLNVNDKSNPNSIASFQVKIIQNTHWADPAVPDQRASIEFHYGPIGNGNTVTTVGAAIGIEDSVGLSHINALYVDNFDSAKFNTTRRTTCYPPVSGCIPGHILEFYPIGRNSLNQWGDGDVNLSQLYSPDPAVHAYQNRFVTLEDADTLLYSLVTQPLDSAEGRNAFHGDANHNGKYTNSFYPGITFYRVTAYDAAYILMYLAAKLPVLPWPYPLPVPGYKATDVNTTSVSAIALNTQGALVNGNTVRVPVIVRGLVNGALGVEMNVSTEGTGLTLSNARGANGSVARMNAAGKVVIALSDHLSDGATIGYIEFKVNSKENSTIRLNNVMANDENMPSSNAVLQFASVGTNGASFGASLRQNVPNPFNMELAGTTSIKFQLGTSESVNLKVYDMLGHEVRSLIAGEVRMTGEQTAAWDGRDNSGNVVASGLYYYQLVTPSFTQTVKMQVIR